MESNQGNLKESTKDDTVMEEGETNREPVEESKRDVNEAVSESEEETDEKQATSEDGMLFRSRVGLYEKLSLEYKVTSSDYLLK